MHNNKKLDFIANFEFKEGVAIINDSAVELDRLDSKLHGVVVEMEPENKAKKIARFSTEWAGEKYICQPIYSSICYI